MVLLARLQRAHGVFGESLIGFVLFHCGYLLVVSDLSELPEAGLEVDTGVGGTGGAKRLDEALTHEVGGAFGRLGEGHAIDRIGTENRGEDVACARTGFFDNHLSLEFHVAIVFAHHIADEVFAHHDAGDDKPLGPHGHQFTGHYDKFGVTPTIGLKGRVGEKTGLGEIGRDDVGILDETLHLAAHLAGIGGIDMAIVAHHWIDEHDGVRATEILDELFDDTDLAGGAQEAGHDAVELQVEFLPLFDICRHATGEILAIERGKARVIREDGCRQRTTLHPQMTDDGLDDRDTATTISRDIVDDCYLFAHLFVLIEGLDILNVLDFLGYLDYLGYACYIGSTS